MPVFWMGLSSHNISSLLLIVTVFNLIFLQILSVMLYFYDRYPYGHVPNMDPASGLRVILSRLRL